MKAEDYIIFHDDNIDKKHNLLGKVEKVNPLLVKLQPDLFGNQPTVETSRKNILCVVGPKPTSGHVYGVDLSNIYRTSVPMDKFGILHYYWAPEKSVRKALKSAFAIAAKKLESAKLYTIFDEQVNYSIRSMRSAGMYYIGNDEKKIPHRIELDPSRTTIEDLPHCILHEIGHFYFNKLDDDWQFKWVNLYATYVQMDRFTSRDMKALRDNFVHSGLSFVEFRKELDEPEQTYFKLVQKHLQKCFKLNPKQLQLLYEENQEVVISKFPTSTLKVNYETLVSEYATKNYHELFAESFAFYLLGMKLPKDVNRLIEKTIAVLRL